VVANCASLATYLTFVPEKSIVLKSLMSVRLLVTSAEKPTTVSLELGANEKYSGVAGSLTNSVEPIVIVAFSDLAPLLLAENTTVGTDESLYKFVVAAKTIVFLSG
jgi:hypothetical protein